MSKTTHTNRGTCQVCGRIQAIDNASGKVAKHGYVVAGYGFFNGVCPGAWHVPAEKSLTVTYAIIEQLTDEAVTHEADAVAYRAHTKLVTTYTEWDGTAIKTHKTRRGDTYTTRGDYVERDVTPKTPVHTVNEIQIRAAAVAEQNARHAYSHVAMMREFIVPRLGQPLAPPKDVARVEAQVAKAKAIEGVRFPTKQSRKDALDKLNRAFDKARSALQSIYLGLPNAERTQAKSDVYYGPGQLNHWRTRHAEAALREFPEAAGIVERINELVKQREEIKNAK
jgi:hypothetical protein